MKRSTLGIFLALFLAAPAALADVPPPDAEGCFNLVAGDACKTDSGKNGGCVKETCSRATPTGTEKYDCLICKEGAQPGNGCSLTPVGQGTLGVGAAMIALAAIGALRRRRSAKIASR